MMMIQDILLCFVLPMLLLALLLHFLDRQRFRNFPPGPPGLPVVGNLLQLRPIPHRSLWKLAQNYGDIMSIRLGSHPAIVVSSSEKAKLFLKTHDKAFAGRFITAAGEAIFGTNDILLAPCNKRWKHLRRMSTSVLLNQRTVELCTEIMASEAWAMAQFLWEESCHGRKAVDVTAACVELMVNINLRMMAGAQELVLGNGSPVDAKALLDEGSRLLGDFNAADFLSFLRWFDLQGIRKRCRRLRAVLDEVLGKVMEDRSHRVGEGEGNDDRKHFLDLLLDLTQTDPVIDMDTAHSIMRDFVAAGTQTTAAAMEWAMSELVRHPQIMRTLRQDIQSVVAQQGKAMPDERCVESMKYLHCVIKETLRLHPPVTLGLAHECTEPVTVEERFHIPKGTKVLFNLWGISRDPRVWENAEEFRPERFMHQSPVDVSGLLDFQMLPFGAGCRRCPGAVLAVPALKISVAALVFSFDWAPEFGVPDDVDMQESYGLSTGRKNRLMLIPRQAYPPSATDIPTYYGDTASERGRSDFKSRVKLRIG